MPVYSQHVRVSFGGRYQASNDLPDIWSCTVNLNQPGGTSAAFDGQTYLAGIKDALGSWFTGGEAQLAQGAFLDYAKANVIGTNGKYLSSSATNRVDYNPAPAANYSPTGPAVLSIATSWRSNNQRGPGSHGRIYLPNCTRGSAGSMTISAVERTGVANAGKALLIVLGSGGALIPVICSGKDGTMADITRVTVGSIKDIQSRRKNAYPETYSSVNYPV